jgi:nucleoid-associated protein YgaU
MGNILVIAIVFIGFSMSMSWVVGQKERTALSEKLEETEVEKKSVEEELAKVEKNLEKEIVKVKEVKEALQSEKEEKAKVEETLLKREAQLKSTGEDVERITKMAHVDEEEAKEIAIEEAKKRAETEKQLKKEVEARKEAESRRLQAELDRVRAEEQLFQKAEELAVVKAESRMLENLRDEDRLEYAKLRQKVEDGKGDDAARMRVRAEDELDAQLATLKEREVALTVELKEAFLAKEETEYRLEREELLGLEAEGKITKIEREAALEKAALKHAKPFSEEEIFRYATLDEPRTGDGWWTEEVIRYRVKEGDTLSNIAAQDFVYGNGNLWVVVYKYNLNKTENPHLIYPGQLLLIPKMISKKEIRKLIRKYYRRENNMEVEAAG